MKRLLFLFLCLFSFSAVWAQKVTLQSQGPITDAANVFSPAQREILRQKVNVFEDSTSNQLVVVTVPNLNGMDAGQYATELGHQWGVGDKKKDNGVIMLIAPNEKKAFIAVGRGLEASIPDALAGRILRESMVPAFKQGKYFEGASAGLDALIKASKGAYKNDNAENDDLGFMIGIFILVVIIFFIFAIIRTIRRNRRGGHYHRDYDDDRGFGGGPIIFMPSSDWGSSSSSSSSSSSDFDFGGGDFGGGGAGDSW